MPTSVQDQSVACRGSGGWNRRLIRELGAGAQQLAGMARVCAYYWGGARLERLAGSIRAPSLTSWKTCKRSRPILRSAVPSFWWGHSFGGMLALEYACRNPGKVAGLVLVDPLAASEWCPLKPGAEAMLRRGIRLARRGAWVARFGIVRMSLDLLRTGSRRIPKFAARVSSGSGSQLTERLVGEVRKLPQELWPVIQSHWCQPKAFLAMADHLEALPGSAAACQTHCDLGDMPITVLSGANSAADRTAEHQAMADRSSRGKLRVAQKSGHWIQLDEPDLVVEAVREIVEQSR